jgi:hypothetical protein
MVRQVIVPYTNDDGDIWIERGIAPWPAVQREASLIAREVGDYDSIAKYIGIEKGVRVSDEHEYPHDEEMEDPQEAADRDMPVCDGCCRTIEAYHFQSVEPRRLR